MKGQKRALSILRHISKDATPLFVMVYKLKGTAYTRNVAASEVTLCAFRETEWDCFTALAGVQKHQLFTCMREFLFAHLHEDYKRF